MNGLRKYLEWMSRGRRTDRVTYVLKEWNLPKPLPDAEWQRGSKFNGAEEILADPNLKEIFKIAFKKGVVVVTRLER
jgi:hypothetical protein